MKITHNLLKCEVVEVKPYGMMVFIKNIKRISLKHFQNKN